MKSMSRIAMIGLFATFALAILVQWPDTARVTGALIFMAIYLPVRFYLTRRRKVRTEQTQPRSIVEWTPSESRSVALFWSFFAITPVYLVLLIIWFFSNTAMAAKWLIYSSPFVELIHPIMPSVHISEELRQAGANPFQLLVFKHLSVIGQLGAAIATILVLLCSAKTSYRAATRSEISMGPVPRKGIAVLVCMLALFSFLVVLGYHSNDQYFLPSINGATILNIYTTFLTLSALPTLLGSFLCMLLFFTLLVLRRGLR